MVYFVLLRRLDFMEQRMNQERSREHPVPVPHQLFPKQGGPGSTIRS
jgi:hypothetical protein